MWGRAAAASSTGLRPELGDRTAGFVPARGTLAESRFLLHRDRRRADLARSGCDGHPVSQNYEAQGRRPAGRRAQQPRPVPARLPTARTTRSTSSSRPCGRPRRHPAATYNAGLTRCGGSLLVSDMGLIGSLKAVPPNAPSTAAARPRTHGQRGDLATARVLLTVAERDPKASSLLALWTTRCPPTPGPVRSGRAPAAMSFELDAALTADGAKLSPDPRTALSACGTPAPGDAWSCVNPAAT